MLQSYVPFEQAPAPLDFAAKLALTNLTLNLAAMSLDQGVALVMHVYASLFEKHYSDTVESRMLYDANLWAMSTMAKEMGTQAEAVTFDHWVQIARSLVHQISSVV